MKIAFTGHSHILSSERIRKAVKEQINAHIANEEKVTFYLGGYGDFDMLCASVCREFKKERKGIELVYVAPYMSLSEQKKIKDMQSRGICDASVYPPIEKTPPRYAIVKRNEWMMENSDLIIAYVERGYGGAYRALQAAKHKNKRTVNIYECIKP